MKKLGISDVFKRDKDGGAYINPSIRVKMQLVDVCEHDEVSYKALEELSNKQHEEIKKLNFELDKLKQGKLNEETQMRHDSNS